MKYYILPNISSKQSIMIEIFPIYCAVLIHNQVIKILFILLDIWIYKDFFESWK